VPEELDFHDGFVDGVLISGSTARIFLRSVAGETFTLVLAEVEGPLVNDLRKGNIIFNVTLLSVDELDADFVFRIYQYSDEHKRKFVLEDWTEPAKKKGLGALEITPSYGCTISALFRGHTMISGHVSA
jgi:hypothetical protein